MIDEFNAVFPERGGDSLHWWRSERRLQNQRYILATGDYGFVVMIDQRPTFAMLITAYNVDRQRRRDKFKREHEAFWAAYS